MGKGDTLIEVRELGLSRHALAYYAAEVIKERVKNMDEA